MVSKEAAQVAAETLRAEHWPEHSIPVDVELIVERMGIDIVPAANLRSDVGVDACISADLESLYVDLEHLQNPVMEYRVRFSVAHELGHAVLHRHVFDAYIKEVPKTVTEWARHVRDNVQTTNLEWQANEFAGCLLVPEHELRDLYDEYHCQASREFEDAGMDLDSADPDYVRAYLANPISKEFEVSRQVIEIRLRVHQMVSNHG